MKKRVTYTIKEEEISSIMSALSSQGSIHTYEQMRNRAIIASDEESNIDEMLLDMHDGMVDRARRLDDNIDKQLQLAYYTIASMLRFLAHEIHFIYKKRGIIGKENKRFLYVICNNSDIPPQSWHT